MGYSRVVLSGENSESKYSNYLCFEVSVQTNKLMSQYGKKYSGDGYTYSQKETHDLIKSLHDIGKAYSTIAMLLNAEGSRTAKSKEWKNSNVHSVLKRYEEGQARTER